MKNYWFRLSYTSSLSYLIMTHMQKSNILLQTEWKMTYRPNDYENICLCHHKKEIKEISIVLKYAFFLNTYPAEVLML